jgi:gluconolactonase
MHQRFIMVLVALSLAASMRWAEPPTTGPAQTPHIIQKIQRELTGPLTEDSDMHTSVPHGQFIDGNISNSKIYPGTVNPFKIYVPAQYRPDSPACLLVKLDGISARDGIVLDNLIAKGDMPITIAVGIVPGMIWKVPGKEAYRWNRSFEFDSLNDNFPNYVLNELLPQVEKLTASDGRPIHVSHNPNDRAAMGASTGGIGAFTLAWERPDFFSRVYSIIGTFVSMRGGDEYPALIRKTEPKAIRIFLEDGSTDAWNPLFGSWFMENQEMEAALTFAGYDVQHAWGVHEHDDRPGNVILPDVLRWLWQGWPASVKAGQSNNEMLKAILLPGENWQMVGESFKAASGLASNGKGEVYFSDAPDHTLYKIGSDGKPSVFAQKTPAIRGEAFGSDGTLYATVPEDRKIFAIDVAGAKTIADGIRGQGIVVTSDNTMYVTEPGQSSNEPSNLWQLNPTGERRIIDSGLLSASGIAFSPDKTLLFSAEASTKWVYSYLTQPDGTVRDKERFYWLHMTDIPNDSGAEDMVVDDRGVLYVATRMGIQVCDRNGRVRAIIPLPTPYGSVRSISWGGSTFDTLYATDGHKVFKRKFKVRGYSQWAPPAPFLPYGGG